MTGSTQSPADFFARHPSGLTLYHAIEEILATIGTVEVRTSKSQVAFRRKRGFAYLWMPGMYLSGPDAEVVLTIALGRRDESPRFKEVSHPSRLHWMHHLELHDPDDIDDEVARWLHEAYERAG